MRPYNSMADIREPTEEEMEAYYMSQRNTDDPMSHLLTK